MKLAAVQAPPPSPGPGTPGAWPESAEHQLISQATATTPPAAPGDRGQTHHSKLVLVQVSVLVDVTQIPHLSNRDNSTPVTAAGDQEEAPQKTAWYLPQDVQREFGVDEDGLDLVS